MPSWFLTSAKLLIKRAGRFVPAEQHEVSTVANPSSYMCCLSVRHGVHPRQYLQSEGDLSIAGMYIQSRQHLSPRTKTLARPSILSGGWSGNMSLCPKICAPNIKWCRSNRSAVHATPV